MKILAIFVILFLALGVDCLSCDCDYQNRDVYCGPAPTCSGPLVFDACGCCQICSKSHGEDCGGPWGIYGKCAPGLECKTKAGTDFLGAGGIFEHIRVPKGTCLNPGEVLQTTQPCFIALKAYQTKYEPGNPRAKRQATVTGTTPSPSPTLNPTNSSSPSPIVENTSGTQAASTNSKPVAMATETTSTVTVALTTTTPCPIKPICTPEGWFAPTQCDPCIGECWCVDYNTGREVPNSRKQGRVQCN